MMLPDPSVDTQDESYLFQGSGQTLIEGDPVPLLYGELRIPGRPVSMVVRNQGGYFYNDSVPGGTSRMGAEDLTEEQIIRETAGAVKTSPTIRKTPGELPQEGHNDWFFN